MSKKIIRSVSDLNTVPTPTSLNTDVNDLIADDKHVYVHSPENKYVCLTDNIKSIKSNSPALKVSKYKDSVTLTLEAQPGQSGEPLDPTQTTIFHGIVEKYIGGTDTVSMDNRTKVYTIIPKSGHNPPLNIQVFKGMELMKSYYGFNIGRGFVDTVEIGTYIIETTWNGEQFTVKRIVKNDHDYNLDELRQSAALFQLTIRTQIEDSDFYLRNGGELYDIISSESNEVY